MDIYAKADLRSVRFLYVWRECMKLRKLAGGLCILLILSLAVSCDKERPAAKPEESTRATNWRNRIEYDGSFYVSQEIKLLYSLDKGSITLWDDKGSGDVLQKLSYDTTVPDAMENLIRTDVNGDGYADLQTVYSQEQGQSCYNLWLWSEQAGMYQACGRYRLIKNPQPDPQAGTVSSTLQTEAFGTVQSTYRFTDALDLEAISQEMIDADFVASAIAAALTGDAAVVSAEGPATIGGEECAAYTVGTGMNGSGAYIAYLPDAVWYIDMYCLGAYRSVEWKEGAYTLGAYMDEAGQVQDLASAYKKGIREITITAKENGAFDIWGAVRYTVEADGGFLCFLCKTESGNWYISTDGTAYCDFAKGEVGAASEYTFS